MLSAFGILCAMNGACRMIGHRVLVDGMMGSGKSTFARALAHRFRASHRVASAPWLGPF